jgi:hypothetical protein
MYIASPEKAILDTLYYRGDIPAGDELELDRVDFDLLSSFAGNYPQTVSRSLFNIISP